MDIITLVSIIVTAIITGLIAFVFWLLQSLINQRREKIQEKERLQDEQYKKWLGPGGIPPKDEEEAIQIAKTEGRKVSVPTSSNSFLRLIIIFMITTSIYYIMTQTSLSVYPVSQLTPTSTLPPTFDATISKPDFCHNGPNDNYGGAFIVPADTKVKVLGMTLEGDWFMIQGIDFNRCWVKANALTLPHNIDLEKILKFITAITLENTPCLIYPSAEDEIRTIIPGNWRIVAYGKNNQDADWVLVIPHVGNEFCWVERTALLGFKNIYLPIETVDRAFTATITPVNIMPTNTPKHDNDGSGNIPTSTPVPPPTNAPIPPTPTLCWPPGHCK